MIYASEHIKKYVKRIVGNNKFFDEFTFAYEVTCSCGNIHYQNISVRTLLLPASKGQLGHTLLCPICHLNPG